MKRYLLAPFISLAVVVALAGCSASTTTETAESSESTETTEQAAGSPVSGGTLKFLLTTSPVDLDPSTSQDNSVSMPLWGSWFQQLMVFDGQDYQPELAESWTVSDDELLYTLNLDPRATFSDGSPVTSDDVVFSLKRNLEPEVSQLNFLNAKIADITAVSPSVVEISMQEPWPHLLSDLASPSAVIYSKAALEAAASPAEFFNTNPVGSGPFVLGDSVANTTYQVLRNENYWNDEAQPYLDEIQFEVVVDETARLTAVASGRADVAQSPPANQLGALANDDKVQVLAFPASRVELFALNVRKAPFDNQNLRQAFSLAMDRAAMVQVGLFGFGDPATTFLVPPPGQTFQNTSLGLYPFDLERAKQLVDESGVQVPIDLPITVSNGTAQEAILAIALDNLNKIGFNVIPSTKDAASVDNEIISAEFTANTTFWGNISGDPSIQALFSNDPAFCCDAYFTGLNDPSLVQKTIAAINETDRSTAQALWDEVQQAVADVAHIVPLYYPQLTYVATPQVQGFAASPAGLYDWAKVWKQ
jgi:peptide/nickel transport system substrate-binding protein